MSVDSWGYHKDFEKFFDSGMVGVNFFSNRSILVTGATGLIGSAFLDFLVFLKSKKGIKLKVVALTRNLESLRERFADALDSGLISALVQDIQQPLSYDLKFDCIVHAASAASPNIYLSDPVGTIKTTVKGMENVLEYGVSAGCKVLYVSSVEVYGETKGISERVMEYDFGVLPCNNVRSSYPEAKRLAEALCQAYFDQYNADVTIVRPCKIYGPSNNRSDQRVMAYILNTIKKGEDIALQSDGSRIFSFCYVTDIVSALAVLLEKGQAGEAYNVADDMSISSLKDIALASAKLAGVSASFKSGDPGAGVSKDAVIASEKLQALGWKALTNMSSGLNKQYKAVMNEL